MRFRPDQNVVTDGTGIRLDGSRRELGCVTGRRILGPKVSTENLSVSRSYVVK